MQKRILITGGLGFVGTNLVPKLQQKGYQVRIFDNQTNASGDLDLSGIEMFEGDLLDAASIDRAVKGMDAVVHLAADTRVMDSIENPRLNFDVNVRGTFDLLSSMREHGVKRIISASTGGAILGEVEPPVNEEMAANPLSPYGAAKLACEGYCSAFAASYGMNAISLRFSNIYGPYCRSKKSAVAAFLKDIVEKGEVTVYGDGTQTRDFLFSEDLTDGIVSAIESNCSGPYQLGSGQPTSLNELLAIIKNVCGEDRPFTIKHEAFRPGEVMSTYCDISKARRDLGFNPTTSLEQGVEKVWRYFQHQMTKQAEVTG